MRLATKSHDIKTAKEFLKDFPNWLNPQVRLIPEAGDWVEDIGMFSWTVLLELQNFGGQVD
jgi:hypothetical protein